MSSGKTLTKVKDKTCSYFADNAADFLQMNNRTAHNNDVRCWHHYYHRHSLCWHTQLHTM